MCDMAEKSPDAPSVPWRCGYGAHDSREAGIDLRECQMTAKNYRPLIRKQAANIRYRTDYTNLIVCACQLAGAGRLGDQQCRLHLGVTRIEYGHAPHYRELAARSCTNRRAARCARDPGGPRQDDFLILKLATYSSGFAGSNGFPITENDLYDVAGGVINFGSEARAGKRGRFTFRLPFGGSTGRSSKEIAEHLCGCRPACPPSGAHCS